MTSHRGSRSGSVTIDHRAGLFAIDQKLARLFCGALNLADGAYRFVDLAVEQLFTFELDRRIIVIEFRLPDFGTRDPTRCLRGSVDDIRRRPASIRPGR